MNSTTTVPKWRKITFYAIVTLVLAMVLGLLWPFLALVVLAWLPVETWQALFPDEGIEASDVVHRIHELSLELIFSGLTIGVALQLWKPQKRQAPMLQALAVIASFVVIDLISGAFDLQAIPIMIGVALLVLLHPARKSLYRFNRPDKAMTGFTVLGVIPAMFFIVDNINLQRLNIAGDPHAEFGHWSTMAGFAAIVLMWGLIGATDRNGWRVTAPLAGISAAAYGVASLVFPNVASALGAGWAVVVMAWGVGYLALAIKRTRRLSIQPADAPTEAASSVSDSS